MADDFIGPMKADWDREGAERAVVRQRRQRWTPHALLAADLLGGVVMAAFGAIYAALAMKSRDLLFALSAIAMLAVGVPLTAVGARMRWRALSWEDETAEGVLRSSLRRLDATRRVLRLGRAACLVLFVLTLTVWAAALRGLVREAWPSLAVITATWILAGLLGLGWVRWRLGRVARGIAGCQALLRQFQRSTGA